MAKKGFWAQPTARWIAVAFAVPVALLVFRGVAPAQSGVSVADAAAMIKKMPDLQLIDVRTKGEHDAGHLANAKLIPVQEIESRLAEIDKTKPVLLYCRTGHRSGTALKTLVGKGYTNATHMEGGIAAWQGAGLPVTK